MVFLQNYIPLTAALEKLLLVKKRTISHLKTKMIYYLRNLAENLCFRSTFFLCFTFFFPLSFQFVYAQAPEQLRAYPENARVSLRWEAANGATKYLIFRGEAENDLSTLVDSTTATQFFDTQRTNKTLYFYTIAAVVGDTARHYSDTVAVVPRTDTPRRDVVNLASFNGASSFLEIDTAQVLNFSNTNDFTIAFWVRAEPQQSSETAVGLIAKRAGAAGAYPYALSMNGKHGRLTFSRSDGSKTAILESGKNINDGAFHHLAMVKSGSTLALYVDGKPQGTADDVSGDPTNTARTTIGKLSSSGAGFFSGQIEELAIFSVGLDSATLATHLRSRQPYLGTEANLLALWHFDEPAASPKAYDAIGNRHPAAVNGAGFEASKAMPPTLKVASTSPGRGAINVPANQPINVRFGIAPDAGSVTDEAVRISRSFGNPPTDAPTLANVSTVSIQPSAPFKAGEEISLTLTGRIKGASTDLPEAFWATENLRYTVAATAGEAAFIALGDSLGTAKTADLVVADFNGDGILDVVFANQGANKVWIGKDDGNGKGSGAFDELTSFGSGNSQGIAAADLNKDGNLDLFVANHGANTVWLGDGAGGFKQEGSYGTAKSNAVVLADFNGDGFPDAFVANETENKLYLNNTDGTFSDGGKKYGTANSLDVAAGDMDADGDFDVVVVNDGGTSVVYLNNGHGIFKEAVSLASGQSKGVAVGNLNGDGFLDLFFANAQGANTVWINTYSPPKPLSFVQKTGLGNADSRHVALADLDADGDLDAYVANVGANKIWLNDGNGNFTATVGGFGDAPTAAVALADLNGDGAIDAVDANSTNRANKPWINGGCAARDRASLLSLYKATGGDSWTNKTNWASNQPLNTWFGVKVNSDGCVSSLTLPENKLTGQIPSSLWTMIALKTIDLGQNALIGVLPPALKNLQALENLTLKKNILSGGIPPQIDSLKNLKILDLADNRFSGNLPEIPTDANLANLQQLNLSGNNLEGSIPASLGKLGALKYLNLSNNSPGFSGNLPTELGNLLALDTLDLSKNTLSGEIPEEIGKLTQLKTLRLSDNGFTKIPLAIEKLNLLEFLFLGRNQITTIPEELGKLFSLKALSLHHNKLEGSIPAPVWQLTGLEHLALNANQLEGNLPDSVRLLTKLAYLNLGSNKFTGKLPDVFGELLQLEYLSVADNMFTSALPDALGNLVRLETLLVNDNTFAGSGISGAVPLSYTVSLRKLKTFNFRNTNVCEPTGNDAYDSWKASVPDFLTNNNVCPACLEENRNALLALYNATNGPQWSNRKNWNTNRSLGEWFGVTTNNLGCVIKLDLSKNTDSSTVSRGNNLVGTIPAEIEGLKALELLNLSHNKLDSLLPETLGTGLTKLKILNLSHNKLRGEIPISLSGITGLEALYLQNNRFSGSLPASISSFRKLKHLAFSDNEITEIPDAVSGLSALEVFEGARNKLTAVPKVLWLLPALERLDISGNQIEGEIPKKLSEVNLPKLKTLNLSKNKFTNFPASILRIPRLQNLFLQQNHIRDSIPVTIDSLNSLVHFNISKNNFLGGVPAQLGNITSLKALFLNDNDSLSGPLPLTFANLETLDTLVFIKTALCEPEDEAFATWRKAILDSGGTYIGTGLCPPCIKKDREALSLFYNSLQGENWKNTVAKHHLWKPDNPSSQVSTWYGVSVNRQGCVVGLNLSNSTGTGKDGNNLRGTIPAAIGNLSALRILNLSYNDSLGGEIPAEIGTLGKLEELSLNGLGLTGKIPKGIWTLEHLDTLDLGNNLLRDSIDVNIKKLRKLRLLNFSKNQLLGGLPKEIGNLTELTHVYMDSVGLSGEVPEEILRLKQLVLLDISKNRFTSVPNFSGLSAWGTKPTEGLRIEKNLLTFGSIEPNMALPDSITFTYAPQDSIRLEKRLYTVVEGRSLDAIFETGGTKNRYEWFKIAPTGEVTSVSASADTALFHIQAVALADSGHYFCRVSNTLAEALIIPTQHITLKVVPAETILAPVQGIGIAPSPLLASAKDQAILGFSARSTGIVSINKLVFPTSTDPNRKFENLRLLRSADSSYLSQEDNKILLDAQVELGVGQIQFTNLIDTLDTAAVYYFVLADVYDSVSRATEAIQLEFKEKDVSVSLGVVKDTTISSLNYTFAALQKMAVFGNDSLIVSGDSIPTRSKFTDMGYAILGDTIQSTFKIVNLGDTTLRFADSLAIKLLNNNEDLFVVRQHPDSIALGAKDTLTFTLGFVAIDTAVREVKVAIASNDSTANPYTFLVRAKGTRRPVLTFSGKISACANDSMRLVADARDAQEYYWKKGDSILSTDSVLLIRTLIDSVHTDSSYTLTLVKDTYTYTSDSFAITVHKIPTVAFRGEPAFNVNPILCAGDSLKLIAEEKNATYIWRKGEEEIGTDSVLFIKRVRDSTRRDYTLTVIKNGCTAVSDSFMVRVRPKPPTTFEGDTVVCAGETLSLLATEPDAIAYTWLKGDSVFSDVRAFTINAIPDSLAGDDFVLKVNKAFCESVRRFSVKVKPLPKSGFAGKTTFCEGQRIELRALQDSAAAYRWTLGDSLLTDSAVFVIDTARLAHAGKNYALSVTNDSCTVTQSFALKVNPAPPIKIIGLDSVCALGQVYTYKSLTQKGRYHWRLDGGKIVGGMDTTLVIKADTVITDSDTTIRMDTTRSVNFTRKVEVVWNDSIESGKIFLTEETTDQDTTYSCTLNDSLQVHITRFVQPKLLGVNQVCEFSKGVVYAAEGIDNKYSWEIKGGKIIEGQNTSQIKVDWDSAGIGEITLSEAPVAPTHCPVSVTLKVEIFKDPTVKITGPKSVCTQAKGVKYSSNTLNGVYKWRVIGGTVVSKPDSSTIFVDWGPAGKGSIRLTQSFGRGQSCLADTTEVVTISEIPNARIVGSRTTCVGAENVQYHAADTTATVYFWKIEGGTITGPLNGDTVLVKWQPNADSIKTGTVRLIQVIKYDSLDVECIDTDEIKVNLDGSEPVAAFRKPAQTPAGIGVRFVDESRGSDNLVAWQWDFGDGRPGSTAQNPIHSYESQGTYEVRMTVRDMKGCTNTVTGLVVIGPRRPDLQPLTVMNVITPNNDGQNDVLYITNIEEYPDNEVLVLNNWGTQVFKKKGYQNDWEATWQKKTLPPGTYICILKVKFTNNQGNSETKIIKESFTILR